VQRPAKLTPNKSPVHFWGAELRARRVDRGMSLEDLGRIVHRDRSYLAKIERGERPVPAELARDCDRALGDDGTLIRLHTMVVESGAPAAESSIGSHAARPGTDGDHVARTGPHVANGPESLVTGRDTSAPFDEGGEISIPARTSDGRVVFVSVSRRMFLGASALSAATVAAPAVLRWAELRSGNRRCQTSTRSSTLSRCAEC
jgi:hypothetical protein